MRTIWKTVLAPLALQHVEVPAGSTLLTVDVQGGSVAAWWVVPDPSAAVERRGIAAVGTGEELPDHAAKHVATVLLAGGRQVVHFFASTAEYVEHPEDDDLPVEDDAVVQAA